MGDILLQHPNHTSPTTTIRLSPARVEIQSQHFEPLQRVIFSESGIEYVYKLTTRVLQHFEMNIKELQLEDVGTFSGALSLLSFIRVTLDYKMQTCSLTEQDGTVTTVRWIDPAIRLREAEGLSRRQGQLSGILTWLKSAT